MEFVLGVLGGSGIYEIEGLEVLGHRQVDTPWGAPSDDIVHGRLADRELLFLPRHGRGHRHAPHELNSRANIAALKALGATHLVSLSAVGSMRPEIKPGDVLVVDQFIDLTKKRINTFFESGLVAHVSMADPVCPLLSKALSQCARVAGACVHVGGTYVCIEGPQFSTRAESQLYRSWGVSVIGMTALPEARLAREAELPYATLALVTDYDCWHETEEDVSVEGVLLVLRENAKLARNIVGELSKNLPDPRHSNAYRALAHAIITEESARTDAARERLRWLLGATPR